MVELSWESTRCVGHQDHGGDLNAWRLLTTPQHVKGLGDGTKAGGMCASHQEHGGRLALCRHRPALADVDTADKLGKR
ncbi:hypothetical protein AN216_20080 [Streptomyces oceani]|uniref:Uncharacterized protein n=1 Tax=Streptomyces oceani TaxID=1075402 RepID=A0A1E7JY40_9ACTN|nr:hypothetical protein AN216_20080 [Streptomyces oceani]